MNVRCTLLGVGAMASPRFAPAGLLVEVGRRAVMLDGGPGAEPQRPISAWRVTDARAELIPALRRLAALRGCEVAVGAWSAGEVRIEPLPVIHTSHPAFGYRLTCPGGVIVWAPEFLEFPRWARGATLMFAEASGWNRRIWFRNRVGGHASALEVSAAARLAGVQRLVLAHLGRPTLRAIDSGARLAFGELGIEGARYVLRPDGTVSRRMPPRRPTSRGARGAQTTHQHAS